MTGIWWIAPRRKEEFIWWQKELINLDTGDMIKYAYITWRIDGKGKYNVSISFEVEGYGLHHWPGFDRLSDAENLVDILMDMSLEKAREYINEIHGKEVTFDE